MEGLRRKYTCKFPNCTSSYYYSQNSNQPLKNKHFYMFPCKNKKEMLHQWKRICNIPEGVNTGNFRVCEDHFVERDFMNYTRERLNRDVIPKDLQGKSSTNITNDFTPPQSILGKAPDVSTGSFAEVAVKMEPETPDVSTGSFEEVAVKMEPEDSSEPQFENGELRDVDINRGNEPDFHFATIFIKSENQVIDKEVQDQVGYLKEESDYNNETLNEDNIKVYDDTSITRGSELTKNHCAFGTCELVKEHRHDQSEIRNEESDDDDDDDDQGDIKFSSSKLLNTKNKTVSDYISSDKEYSLSYDNSPNSSSQICDLEMSVSENSEYCPFSCEICGKSFARKGHLYSHFQIHTEDLLPFSCNVCGKSFKHKDDLKRHTPIHSYHKLFCCETCGKCFNDRSNFKKHKLVHGRIKFSCDVCGRSFTLKSCLYNHLHTCNPLKFSFSCDICKKVFTTKNKLSTHMKLHIGDLFPCDVCGKAYSRRESRDTHMHTHKI
ncbi:hypothetical protein C0J52_23175 [Blattella germanica]|nr:hypothetical protein C0J52_23175 [Blattella germanica]